MEFTHLLFVLSFCHASTTAADPLTSSATPTEFPNVCQRFYLRGLDPKVVGQVQAVGVYERLAYTFNNFTVYQLQDSPTPVYFYLDIPTGNLHLGLAVGDDYFGVGAMVRKGLPGPLGSWFMRGRQPFQRIIDQWFAYDYTERMNKPLDPSTIQPYCVDEEEDGFHKCTSKTLYLNRSIPDPANPRNLLNDPNTDYLEQMSGMSIYPLYRLHSRGISGEMYLYYHEDSGMWLLGPHMFSEYGSVLRVQDTAVRAEYITGTWQQKSGSGWTNLDKIAIKCKGIPRSGNESCNSSCGMSARCYENGLGEVVCGCKSGYEGLRCEDSAPNCKPQIQDNYLYNDHIATTFCDLNRHMPPKYWFSVCQLRRSGNQTTARWVKYGRCRDLPTPPPSSLSPTTSAPTTAPETTTITDKPRPTTYKTFPALDPESIEEQVAFYQWVDNNYSWLVPLIVILSLLVQIGVPLVIWLCKMARMCRAEKTVGTVGSTPGDVQEVLNTVQERLDTFYKSHPEPVEEYSAATLAELMKIEQAWTAEEITKAEFKGQEVAVALKTPSFCRICSGYFYCSLWVWLVFALVCEFSGVIRHSRVMHTLAVVAHLITLGLYATVLVETYRSRERRLLAKLAAAKSKEETLRELKELQPEVLMSAKCWHWETKTYRTSKNTDGGYSSTKTRDGRVVSAHIVEPIAFERWLDATDVKDVVFGGLVNKIRVYTVVLPGDSRTQAYIEQQYYSFCQNHQDKDKTVELDIVRGVTSAPRLAVLPGNNHPSRPWWLSEAVFWVFSVLGFTWPYRLHLHKHVSTTHLVLVKRLYASQPQSPITFGASSPFDATHLLPGDATNGVNGVNLVGVKSSQELPTSDLDTSSEYSAEDCV